jgi:hypothetical protein
LGCGDYSTPVLSAIARRRGSRFVVNSSNPEWANRFNDYAEVEIVDWETWTPKGKWGLIMLDNEQFTCERIRWIPKLSKICEVIVMHDADAAMLSPEYSDLTEGLESMIDKKHTPWTVVFRC